METSYVLSGLSRKCDLKLISPEAIYMRCNWSALQNQRGHQVCNIHCSSLAEKIGVQNVSEVTSNFACLSDNQALTLQTSENVHDCSQNPKEHDVIKENSATVVRKRKLEDWSVDDREKLKLNRIDCQTQIHECIESLEKSNGTDENVQNDNLCLNLSLDTNVNVGTVLSCDTYGKSDQNAGISESANLVRSDNDLNASMVDDVEKISYVNAPGSPRHSEFMGLNSNSSGTSVNLNSSLHYTKDLPLMANVDDVLVKHYILDLDVDFKTKVISGTIVLFIEPARLNTNDCNFQMCLDSTMVTIDSAVEVPLPNDLEIHFHNERCCCEVVEDNEAPAHESFIDSNPKGTFLYSGANSDKAPQCSNCHEDGPQSCDSSFQSNNLDSALRYRTTDEGHSCRNGGRMHDYNSQYENSSSIVCDNNSQDSYSLSSLGAETAGYACKKDIRDKDTPGKANFKCRHCQFLHELKGSKRNTSPLKFKKLAYSIHGWCIRIWKEGDDAHIWPRCIKLWYRTSPEGQSIMWAKDQDGKLVEPMSNFYFFIM